MAITNDALIGRCFEMRKHKARTPMLRWQLVLGTTG